MKKSILVFTVILALVLGACGNKEDKTSNKDSVTTLKVASLIPPMTDILEQVKPILEKENINLKIVVLTDNIQPNTALANKEVDANFFQHKPFMEEYNKANDSNLVAIQQIYYPNFGIYSKKYKTWAALPKGSTVAIANDLSNIDRTLQLLEKNKAITLKKKTGTYYTVKDVKENKKNLKFKEVDLLMLARMYDEADAVVMYPAYAAPLGLTPKKDAIMTEGVGNEYALQLVTREDNKNDEAIQKLKKAMTSETVRKFLEEKYDETATPAFK